MFISSSLEVDGFIVWELKFIPNKSVISFTIGISEHNCSLITNGALALPKNMSLSFLSDSLIFNLDKLIFVFVINANKSE